MSIRWLTSCLVLGLSLLLPRAAISDHHEFSIVKLPDTQTYTALRPQIMEAQIDWITANRVTENIIYVGHLGDLKDVGACVNGTLAWPSLVSPSTEWEIVRGAFDDLDSAGIPYGVTPGNHDFDQRNGVFPADSGGCPNYDGQRPLVGYNGEFPPSSFPVTNYGSRLPGSNEDNFTIVSSNGVDFLFINIGYQQAAPAAGSTAVIDWAETLMTTYPNHIAIVTSHFLIDCNASTSGGGAGANGSCAATPDYNMATYGSNIFDRLRIYPNLFMMIGGHRFGESYIRLDRTAEGFNPVHVVLANYQHLLYSSTNFETVPIPGPGSGSSGYFKLMRFDMDSMTVDLDSLSPALAANGGIAGGPGVLPVLSNGNRPTTVFSTRDIDPTNPANLVDGSGNPTLHTQSVSNLVNISFAGYVTIGGGGPTALAYDEAVSGDLNINSPQTLNLGVGSNTVTGTVTWSNASGIATDFDGADLVIPAGNSITSVTMNLNHQAVGAGLWARSDWNLTGGGVNGHEELAMPAPGGSINLAYFASELPSGAGTFSLRNGQFSGLLAQNEWRRASYTLTIVVGP